jgi:hypothetical protein
MIRADIEKNNFSTVMSALWKFGSEKFPVSEIESRISVRLDWPKKRGFGAG